MVKPRVGVKVSGLARFRTRMRGVSDAIKEGVVVAVREETDVVVEEMKLDAPVDTGYLVENIHARFKRKGFTGQAVSSADYTKYVVNGTSTHRAQDFMTPAAIRSKKRFPDLVAERVREQIRRQIG